MINHWYYSAFPETVGRRAVDTERLPFIWKTSKGELTYLEDMDTNHLFNTARMLYNNALVPPAFRVGNFIRHDEIRTWEVEYVIKAYELMRAELDTRFLDQDIVDQINDMDGNIEFVCGSSVS